MILKKYFKFLAYVHGGKTCKGLKVKIIVCWDVKNHVNNREYISFSKKENKLKKGCYKYMEEKCTDATDKTIVCKRKEN